MRRALDNRRAKRHQLLAPLGLGRALTASLLFCTLSHTVCASEQSLLLDIQVNGYPINKIGEFMLRDGAMLSRRDELTALGFRLPDTLLTAPDALINLADLPRLSWRLDQANQILRITAADERLQPTLLQVSASSRRSDAVESSTGATLNYDLSATSAAGHLGANGLFELRTFSPWGVLSSGMLASSDAAERSAGSARAARLDSTYTLSDPASLRRYRLGDFISSGLAWTRPLRLGGAQISSDFGLRPDLVTFPLPTLSGSASVPSTLDVLVNGTRLLSQPVGVGPFEIPQLPVVTGAGIISMSLTNALGRQVIATVPFYASSALLATDLQTFSAQIGAVRRNWGEVSNDYGQTVASASYRRGLTPMLTVEATAEGTAGTLMAGGGAAVHLGNFALLNVAAARSSSAVGTGSLLTVGLQRVGAVFSFATSATASSRNFRDIAAVLGDPSARQKISASAGLSLGKFGSLGIAYAGLQRDATSAAIASGSADVPMSQKDRVLSASYSVQVSRMSLYVSAFHNFGAGGGRTVQIGLAVPLGQRSSVGVGIGTGPLGRSGQMQAQQSAVSVGDWGYQAYASGPSPSHQFAQVEYKSRLALLTAGADRTDRQTTLALKAAGALSWVDGTVFASNTIDDSFAVVDTNGLGGVRVLHENRDAGRTNASGRLLVPGLRAFEVNLIAIDATDVPGDVTINDPLREVRPQDRSGIVLKFSVKLNRGALLRLVDENGVALPVGSKVRLAATDAAFPVGYEGEVFAEDLAQHNMVVVERPDGRRCSIAFDYQPLPGDIPVIGPLTCRAQRP